MSAVFLFLENMLHIFKENLLRVLSLGTISKSIKFNLRFRTAFLAGTFSVALLAAGYYFYPVLISLGFFIVCLYFVLFLCHPVFNRGWIKNIIFMCIFCVGVYSYIELDGASSGEAGITVERQTGKVSDSAHQTLLRKVLSSIQRSDVVTAAFFPSRGTYEVFSDGKIAGENEKITLLSDKIWLMYVLFHTSAYIFVGYFVMSLWGYRTINRIRFWVTRDCEKNVFWCVTPEPKMMQLAMDIVRNAGSLSMPVFSVEETQITDSRTLFQEMNYQYFCLKLRKPNQIHSQCLRASRHFFLSEDTDWNVKMAQTLLSKCKKAKTHVYIRISNDARRIYYTRWADKYKNTETKIIFIDECALVVDRFIQNHHLLASGVTVNDDASIEKPEGFDFLLLGFGGLGQEVLKHLICDSRFTDSGGKVVKFHADIVDRNAEKFSLFKEQFKELCNHDVLNVQLDFHVCDAGGVSFYTFLEEKLKPAQKYDRIIVALGNSELNIETMAQMENIIRKNIDLTQNDPQKEIALWKEKIFLISPEISRTLVDNDNNIFTLVGADNEIFTWADIVNEEMFRRAKLVNYRYIVDHSIGEERERISARHKLLPQWLVKILSDKVLRREVESEWEKADFYSRRSSYAAALGLENIRLLLKKQSSAVLTEDMLERLGKIEHYRWWAFMLGEGYVTWQNPEQRLGILVKANQTQNFLRHATMVDWEKLPELDEKFPEEKLKQGKTFQEKDYELIKGLPDFFEDQK